MCSLDRKVGGILVDQNYGRAKEQKSCVVRVRVQSSKKGKPIHDK
jgi:hypothetical protein